ncbi:MAG TPA: CBS domain-containing protein [Acidobacteriaceae bacterium]|nr:CBS domain-containing protein [Acidobacteriaceae bacterium]
MNGQRAMEPTLTMMLGAPVVDAGGRPCGRVKDLAVGTGADAGRITSLVLKTRQGPKLVAATSLRHTPSGALEMRDGAQPEPLRGGEDFIFLSQDVLDQQIIDVHGRKVVRVNDVDLQWFAQDGVEDLRVREVEVGLRGAVRRLLQGVLPAAALNAVAMRFPARVIPWEFVDLIEVDPARRVKLKIEHERLAQLHPSDIADILEDLAPAEREAVLTTLDEELAADALEEVEPKLQKSLMEGLDSETAAGIVEEMDPSAAADLLAELPESRSEAILEEMDPDERKDVEELLEFREDSAAGRMTTEYVAVSKAATVADAVRAMRDFDGDIETVTEIYLIDDKDVLEGVVPLARIVLAEPEARLETLVEGRFISCAANARDRQVAELFDKYNLRALPVLDNEGHLVGVVEADHVIGFLRQSR